MTLALETDEVAAMGAAIDHRVNLAVLAAGDDDRRLAEKRRLVVARVGQLVGQDEELPSGAEKQSVQLGAVDVGIGKDAVGDPRIAFLRPGENMLVHRLILPSGQGGKAHSIMKPGVIDGPAPLLGPADDVGEAMIP